MNERIVSIIVQGVLALVLVIGMIWIVIEPSVNDETTKAALVIIGSAVGFIFGRQTAPSE